MRDILRWMCGFKVTDRFTCSELRERLGTDSIRLRWYQHVLRKGEKDWVKKCMDYEV